MTDVRPVPEAGPASSDAAMPADAIAATLSSARALFNLRGYAGTTMKSVAAAAQVAPGIVTSLYRNKEDLFAAAMRLPFNPAEAVPRLVAPGLDGMGERLVRMTLSLMDDAQVRRDLADAAFAVRASAGGDRTQAVEQAARTVTDYLQVAVIDRVVSALGIPDARMRAAVVTSVLGGMVGTRYALRIEPLASVPADEVAALYGPIVQRLLDPTVPLRSSALRWSATGSSTSRSSAPGRGADA